HQNQLRGPHRRRKDDRPTGWARVNTTSHRTFGHWLRVYCVAAATLLAAPVAGAQQGDELSQAESAFRDIDFERCAAAAARALESGGRGLHETARLYSLLGISLAALGQHDEAMRAFVKMLAIEPEQRVESSLSPKLRAPYLDAKGFWGTTSERLRARVEFGPHGVTVRITDPVGMASKLRIATRGSAESTWQTTNHAAAPVVELAHRAGDELEFTLSLLDEHGNTIHELGSQGAPEHLRRPRSIARLAPSSALDRAGEEVRPSRAHPLPWVTAGLAVLGAGATATGVYFHVQREARASEWNGPDCERPGLTRGAQCASIDEARRRDQTLAIGLYTAGGTLLTGALVTYLLWPGSARTEAAFACSPSAAFLGCSYQRRF
ncbi:MAG TPA: hypothetical protein VFQ61_16425, partial [Polyangiaceae bacterium]|nr:hypothetical protein [Polyangiaceae bacterium]